MLLFTGQTLLANLQYYQIGGESGENLVRLALSFGCPRGRAKNDQSVALEVSSLLGQDALAETGSLYL
jgi:hypothetical protein